MNIEQLLDMDPYGLSQAEKRRLFTQRLSELTRFHRANCAPYRRWLDALNYPEDGLQSPEKIPMLPVSLFKELTLRSVPEEAVFKTITSSGTTGQQVSRIDLDTETAASQQRALSHIVSHFIGPQRIPLLVIDSPEVLHSRSRFSARGAGVLGFSVFGSRLAYALDRNMELDMDGLLDFQARYGAGPVLLFGFTSLVWQHFVLALEERGRKLSLPQGVLIHGGGWKRLQSQAVDKETFRRRVKAITGVRLVSDYYGMAEQTGCIYMECPMGHLHASLWSDVIVRRPADYETCQAGEEGVLEVLSLLPRSYPGHALLTEDMGVLLGEDDCPCGRLGKYFSVTGRVPRAEVRGCSDTYEG